MSQPGANISHVARESGLHSEMQVRIYHRYQDDRQKSVARYGAAREEEVDRVKRKEGWHNGTLLQDRSN